LFSAVSAAPAAAAATVADAVSVSTPATVPAHLANEATCKFQAVLLSFLLEVEGYNVITLFTVMVFEFESGCSFCFVSVVSCCLSFDS